MTKMVLSVQAAKARMRKGIASKRMRRCADVSCLLKANRQHGRKQERLCVNRAELSIEDPSKLTL